MQPREEKQWPQPGPDDRLTFDEASKYAMDDLKAFCAEHGIDRSIMFQSVPGYSLNGKDVRPAFRIDIRSSEMQPCGDIGHHVACAVGDLESISRFTHLDPCLLAMKEQILRCLVREAEPAEA